MNMMTDPGALSLPHTLPRTLPRTGATPPVHLAEDLTRGGSQALIALNGQVYTLRITRAGKLILTK